MRDIWMIIARGNTHCCRTCVYMPSSSIRNMYVATQEGRSFLNRRVCRCEVKEPTSQKYNQNIFHFFFLFFHFFFFFFPGGIIFRDQLAAQKVFFFYFLLFWVPPPPSSSSWPFSPPLLIPSLLPPHHTRNLVVTKRSERQPRPHQSVGSRRSQRFDPGQNEQKKKKKFKFWIWFRIVGNLNPKIVKRWNKFYLQSLNKICGLLRSGKKKINREEKEKRFCAHFEIFFFDQVYIFDFLFLFFWPLPACLPPSLSNTNNEL